ncbi:MAG: amidase family protein [Firmicutes bacterium]|nr:amidase family protein [Bacillota bacterium]
MIKSVYISNDIMVKGLPATAGSKALAGFAAPFSATTVERLRAAGIEAKHTPVGVAGFPSDPPAVGGARPVCDLQVTEFSFYDFLDDNGIALPQDAPTLCNDYCGAHKFFAAKNRMVYLHPTYGRVSRFGLIQAVSSMDQIGIAGKDVTQVFRTLEIISGRDERDIATFDEKYKIEEYDVAEIPAVIGSTSTYPFLDTAAAVHFILSAAEFSNNVSRYDGVKFGCRSKNYKSLEQLYLNSRGEGFGTFIKTAVIAGTALLSKDYYADYYEKALRLRRHIKNETESLLGKYAVIALTFDIHKEFDFESAGLFSLPALTGLPALSLYNGDGQGLLLIARPRAENDLLAMALALNMGDGEVD